ncbi:hypothetical protein V511_04395 [Mesotoga sp. Brook.08.YT.4.2.5.1]|jgi:hypothetical protein|uniref:hypothetical protein n=1 Tax=unclassified Mesotoga TaxID=1184398 RepID=UPI000C1A4CC0|nr:MULTISPECIES: hypothetical protein [unclassified Mesotoga]PNE23110.1 hypothetical protein V511_04395 [Mesotoga sp. Brook.08.YT.4.2.5.1]PNS41966.1 hypothetical protein RJ60_02830 [Mesotoga sp. B105.6.4]PVD15816.1 hypothetical protein V512_002540 [Mesotoga sp. Brook.08.105.5.1]RAO97837.1 hypothetical protein M388_08990 [Mesotoga sp. Brook.08.YT.4.2.5.4.]RDI93842.1 hypothetical protein Q502_02865 [Mesotoga sp. Brook.08.YT.4.2.5.2.]
MAKRRRTSPALAIGLFLIMAAIIGFIFSLIAINKVGQMEAELTQMRKQYDQELLSIEDDFKAKLASVERLLGSGGTLEQYIVAKNFLSNTTVDLEAIITEAQKASDRPYFRVFVTGTKDIWVGIKKASTDSGYFFQKNFKPGLSQEKFYYFKNPEVETKYTIMVGKDAYLRAGAPESVYLIFFGFDSGKLVRMPSVEITNLSKDLNLYIPGS